MEADILSLTQEMKKYYLQITKADNDNSLTTIQKKAYQANVQKRFETMGLKYFISIDSENDPNYHRLCFPSPPWHASGVATIQDVSEKGAYPFTLLMRDNISIKYDPRKVDIMDSYRWGEIPNKKFLNIKKGSDYQFQGKISCCNYYFAAKPEKFDFDIMGNESQFSLFLRNLF